MPGSELRPALAVAALVVGMLNPPVASAQSAAFRSRTVPAVAVRKPARRPGALEVVASAVIPGSGQLLTGRERGAVYLIAEAALMGLFVQYQTEGRHERSRYRDLAFEVARGQFAPARRDTTFEYFEQMEKYVESGPFDTDPGDPLVPPTDVRSYNGAIWRLARETFFTNPDSMPATDSEEYLRAIAFYSTRAIGPGFQWSWRNAGLEQDLFRQSIHRSDDAFRRATQQLGLLLANHVLSAVDAFLSRRLGGSSGQIEVNSTVWRAGSRGPVLTRTAVTVRF